MGENVRGPACGGPLQPSDPAGGRAASGTPQHIVARVDEIPPGSRKLVTVAGREIAVFNLDGAFYALRNRCPHQGGPLCKGLQFSALSADVPGEYRRERAGELIRCPWHGWEFDIRTGRSWFDPTSTRVRSYDVQVRSGAQLVAETYPASVRDDYVVVDLGPRGRESPG
jgi:nitrite reductase/ring-hydroxylating ferredoxin subunit